MADERPFVALTIAGSDSSGGAGVQADLRTFQTLGVYGTCAITAVTAQNTDAVRAIHEIPPEMVGAQIDAVAEEFTLGAVKTGMLANAAIIQCVVERIRHWNLERLVIDPVMVATRGRRLLREDAIAVLTLDLFPLAMVVTPNVPEAEVLLGRSIDSDPEVERATRELVERFGCSAAIIKGGHRQGPQAIDVLFDGERVHTFSDPRVAGTHLHGGGCLFSAAITAGLARGLALADAVADAKVHVSEAMRQYARGAGGVLPDAFHMARPR
jgi:hydroxymethylpyrimidine kinase/phosphomethylpyrimidine kinase